MPPLWDSSCVVIQVHDCKFGGKACYKFGRLKRKGEKGMFQRGQSNRALRRYYTEKLLSEGKITVVIMITNHKSKGAATTLRLSKEEIVL